jgi:single-strand DNA-binding protein
MVDNVLIGRMCQDPILRQTKRGGRPMAAFTVAVHVWRRVDGELVERPTVFHRVVCFGPLAENVSNTLRKGMEVIAVGEWIDDTYTDEAGTRRVQAVLDARMVGPGLRWASAAVNKTDRVERVVDHTAEPPPEAVADHAVDQPADQLADVLPLQPVRARAG